MSLLFRLPLPILQSKTKTKTNPLLSSTSAPINPRRRSLVRVNSFFNPTNDPLLKEALKEPAAFMGGLFAGLLRLDLNEEPLREWISRTVEAAGITVDEINQEESKEDDDAPQEIEIE